MIHRMTFQSNPRLIIMALLIVGLPVAGVLTTVYLSDRGGIVGLAAAGYFVYHLLKFLIPQLKSRIETSDTGLTCHLPRRDPLLFQWEHVTYAGLCRRTGSSPTIFLYDQHIDQMVSIPNEFSHFADLHQMVQAHTPYQEIELGRDKSLKDWLRKQVESKLPGLQADPA